MTNDHLNFRFPHLLPQKPFRLKKQKYQQYPKGASDGIIITTFAWGYGDSKNIADQFKNNYKRKFNKEPSGYSALCYDALMVVTKVLLDGQNNVLTIKEKLNKSNYNGVTGLTTFDKYGEVNKNFKIYRIVKNNFEDVN